METTQSTQNKPEVAFWFAGVLGFQFRGPLPEAASFREGIEIYFDANVWITRQPVGSYRAAKLGKLVAEESESRYTIRIEVLAPHKAEHLAAFTNWLEALAMKLAVRDRTEGLIRVDCTPEVTASTQTYHAQRT